MTITRAELGADEFAIAVDEIRFAAIYEPFRVLGADNLPPRYGCEFPIEYLSPEARERWFAHHARMEKLDWVHTASQRRPEVFEINGRYSDLVDVLAEADARNVSRNKMLQGIPAILHLRWYRWTTPTGKSAESLALTRIDISVDALRFTS